MTAPERGADGALVGARVLSREDDKVPWRIDGVDDRVVLGNVLVNGATQMTVAAWVYKESTTGEGRVISKAASTSLTDPSYIWSLGISGDVVQVRLPTGAGVDTFNGPRIAAKRWTHVAFTYDGSAVRIYVNGRVGRTYQHTGPIPASNIPAVIGNSDNGVSRPVLRRPHR